MQSVTVANSFSITTPASTAPLNGSRQGTANFTVTNSSGKALRGEVRIVADLKEAGPWLTIDGEPQRDFPIGGTQQYVVRVSVPPDAKAAHYTFRLGARGVDN